jgi:DNA-binding XRE family transcriptional regulator
MAKVLPALNDYVRRLARREIRAESHRAKRVSSQHRNDIAVLKRVIRALADRVGTMERHGSRIGTTEKALKISSSSGENLRFRIDGLRSHRQRLGLSAKDYGKLVGVSGLTIYHWEAGKAKPRRRQLPAIAAVRTLGKREALRRLAQGKPITPE